MKSYTHLTGNERYYIYIAKKSGASISQIARDIERSKSTVSRELKRNKGLNGCYRYKQAQNKYTARQINKVQSRISSEVWDLVTKLIKKDYSPEQVSGFLALQNVYVSHERIYQFILSDKKQGGKLHIHLRCQRFRKRRYGKPDRRGIIKDRRCISERPSIVDTKTRLGDWEADLVLGKNNGNMLLTLAERKSRLYLIGKVKNKTAVEVTKCILKLLKPLKEYVQTITFDNGQEFSKHLEIGKILGAETYFTRPYHAWERGLNENFNGLLRQYYPKGQSLDAVSDEDIIGKMLLLNHRPRKCLGFISPYQAFINEANSVALST